MTQQNTSSSEESAAASEELSSQSNQLKQLLGKFMLKAASDSALPAGLPPEMLAAIQHYLASQGMGSPARKTADWTPSQGAKSSDNGKAMKMPKPVISLDDAEFGRF